MEDPNGCISDSEAFPFTETSQITDLRGFGNTRFIDNSACIHQREDGGLSWLSIPSTGFPPTSAIAIGSGDDR